MTKRYVLECEWSGYVSTQRKCVHREVMTKPDHYGVLQTVQFTDGTTLQLRVREAAKGERVKPLNGYGSLLWDASRLAKRFVNVMDLQKKATI